jgi:hypothetical protein
LFEENVAQKLSENPGFESYEDYFAGVEESLASAESNDTKPFENPMDLQNRFNVDVQNSDDGFEILPTVNSFVLRSIVNKHGVIQIGEILYQYDGEVVAKVPSAKVTDFTDLFSNPDAKFETYIGSSSAETELKRNLEGICNINYRTNRRDHRLKPRWYSDFVKIGGEKVGETWIEAKHQKKRWGVWFANSEDRIRMSGTWNLFTGAGLPAEFTDVNETCTNCSKLEEIIGLMPTTDAEKDRTDWIISGNTTNTTEDGGVTRTCIINN